jgi:hypothetical protein
MAGDILHRLELIVDSLHAGVSYVGVLPSCVRVGPAHLPHLQTLLQLTGAHTARTPSHALGASWHAV